MKILNQTILPAILLLTFFSLTASAQVANCGDRDYNCKIADPSPYKSRALAYRKQGQIALAEADERKAESLAK